MSKRKKGNHGIYELTCISRKCGKRFGVMWDCKLEKVAACRNPLSSVPGPRGWFPEHMVKRLTYPFTGCPFCGVWWCTGPLDGEAYPKREKVLRVVQDSVLLQAILQAQHLGSLQGNLTGGVLGGLVRPWWQTKWTW